MFDWDKRKRRKKDLEQVEDDVEFEDGLAADVVVGHADVDVRQHPARPEQDRAAHEVVLGRRLHWPATTHTHTQHDERVVRSLAAAVMVAVAKAVPSGEESPDEAERAQKHARRKECKDEQERVQAYKEPQKQQLP